MSSFQIIDRINSSSKAKTYPPKNARFSCELGIHMVNLVNLLDEKDKALQPLLLDNLEEETETEIEYRDSCLSLPFNSSLISDCIN